MRIVIQQTQTGSANGIYTVYAPGCVSASLFWANTEGALEGWTSFARIPIMPNGEGLFVFDGKRSIPQEATHIYVRAMRPDLTYEEGLQEIPCKNALCDAMPLMRCVVFSDLHLSTKDWKVRRALRSVSQADCILFAGDMTNDGTPEQIAHFYQCANEILPNTPIFPIAGNHDIPKNPIPQVIDGICDYYSLQNSFLQKAEQLGWSLEHDSSGAYVASFGNFEVIGLNAVSHWRKFTFEDGDQLDWLDKHLKNSTAKHKILLCHAPLFDHAFHRPKQPYLNRNKQLQDILDSHENIVYLSGHTHYSLNCPFGCAEEDINGNIYVNTGSVCPTLMLSDDPLQDEEWTEGNGIELKFYDDCIEVVGFSLKSKRQISRGYYRFKN